MNIRDNGPLRERLAAAYVLGTLKHGARRRFEGWMVGDAALRRTATEWQDRLMPLVEMTSDKAPPPRLWRRIERSVGLAPQAPWWAFWRHESASLWRPVGMVASAAAVILAVALSVQLDTAPAVQYVATLTDDKNQTALVLTVDHRQQALTVRMVGNAPVASDKTLQLWAVPKQGKPRSLGILAATGERRFAMPDHAVGAEVALLAVSIEPKGGSPDPNGPTGPILYKGNWVNLM
jgi:anti-sigma-K factor RskA